MIKIKGYKRLNLIVFVKNVLIRIKLSGIVRNILMIKNGFIFVITVSVISNILMAENLNPNFKILNLILDVH